MTLAQNQKKGKTIDPKQILDDPIARQWVVFCLAEDQNETGEWYKEKLSFWSTNQDYLKTLGFSYEGNIAHSLDSLTIEKIEDMQGCLLVVKVGNDAKPAGPNDIDLACKLISDALDDVTGVRVLVTHHAIEFKKISLPQLRRLQSEVLSSTMDEAQHNPIIGDLELG